MTTVLVATERDLEQNLLAQALDGRGYQIIRSRDGLDALETARSKTPQVLLANVALPKLDGFALFRRFQQDEQLRRIPIVLFSTRSNDQKSERFALELGASHFVGNALKQGALQGVLEAALAAPAPSLPVVAAGSSLQQQTGGPISGMTPVDAAVQSAVDRTERLPALIALPESDRLQQLQVEQERLQQALHAAQQQLSGAQVWQELFASSPVAMWVLDKDQQNMLAVNDAALQLFAYGRDEFMQLDGPALLREQTQTNVTNVFAFRSQDGRALSLLVNTRDLPFAGRSAELWTAHDVSYRVRGERAMADEVQRVKALLTAMPVAYCVIDADGKLHDANAACCQLLGYSREQLLEQGLSGLLHDPQQMPALTALTAGQQLPVALRHGDGSYCNVELLAGQRELNAGLRLLVVQAVRESTAVDMALDKPASISKLPVVLEMLRYAEDADENTLLQYAMAQLANAFDSPLALFASLERVTQTLEVSAISHAQANRRSANSNGSIPVPAPWRCLLTPRSACSSQISDEVLLVTGLPEISGYAACSAGNGHELWLLAVANRDAAYSAVELRELQEYADILVALLARQRQQLKLQATARRNATATEQLFTVLEQLLDQHDPHAAGSGQRVAGLAVHLAQQLGLSAERQAALSWAARLHDLGHLLLPQSLLLQPASLGAAERALMQTHVERGVRLLHDVDLGGDIAGIVLQHHERMNGSGYPAALRGEQISLEARILAVADVVEAMSAARAYRPALGVRAALGELSSGAGQLYDAEVVSACERVFATHEGRWPA